MRVTLDSTILVRAHRRATGSARAVLIELLDGGHHLILSASLLEEVERVLHYPRLLKRFALSEVEIMGFITFLAAAAIIADPDETTMPPIRDPKDVHVLQTAIGGRAEYLCTLDEHFYDKPVATFCANRGITILPDPALLHLIRTDATQKL